MLGAEPQPAATREFRAAWVATVANIDWPSKPGLPVGEQRAEMDAILKKAEELHLNAVIFQVRPTADALYESKYEPWSWYLTGEQGVAPEGNWDPLAYMVKEGHQRGIEVHAWFNPYRALHPAQKGAVAGSHISKTNPGLAKQYGAMLWMDPGEKAVQDRSYNVFLDVVKRYDVDGIHIDDYFYPYKVRENGKEVEFPDEPSWQAYRASGGTMSRSDWRRSNVDAFIKRVYRGIKRAKPWVKFGISPFGVYRPQQPAGISAGVDQYEDLYADARKWLVEGWCDYYTPQLYWPIDQKAQSYPVLLKWWTEQSVKGRPIWPGSFTSRVGAGAKDWKAAEIVNQMKLSGSMKGAGGAAHFSMKAFMDDSDGLNEALLSGPYKERALVPAMPWLDAKAPHTPTATVNWSRGQIHPKGHGEKDLRYWAVYELRKGAWSLVKVTAATEKTVEVPLAGVSAVAVSAVDRTGNESPKVIRRRR